MLRSTSSRLVAMDFLFFPMADEKGLCLLRRREKGGDRLKEYKLQGRGLQPSLCPNQSPCGCELGIGKFGKVWVGVVWAFDSTFIMEHKKVSDEERHMVTIVAIRPT